MAVSKLSQIASAPSNFTTGDVLVGVRSGSTDLLYSAAQIGIVAGSSPITGGTDKRVLFDRAGLIGEDSGLNYDYTAHHLTVGTGAAAQASPNDVLTVAGGGTFGFFSLNAPLNADVGMAFSQGGANSNPGQGFFVQGIPGTTSDSAYGLDTTNSGRNSGDYVFQTFISSAFKNIFYVPFGHDNVHFSDTVFAGTQTVTVNSPKDFFTVADNVGNFGFFSLNGTAANADVGFAMNQGSTNGSAGNGFVVFGVVGTNADVNYGLSTTSSGRNSGDVVCQTFFGGGFKQIWCGPLGTSSFVAGAGSVATTATDGFLYIPSCNGTPTGVPTTQTGRVPMVFDTSTNKFYIYNSGWKGGTTPGAFT